MSEPRFRIVPDFWLPVPHLRQESKNTCTPACIRMVLCYFGVEISESEIARLVLTDGFGTLFDDVIRVAKLGFDVTLGNGSRSDLLRIGATKVPLIASVHSFWLPNYGPPGGPHCVVIAGATSTEVAVFDPDRSPAPTLMPFAAFVQAWEKRKFRYAQICPP